MSGDSKPKYREADGNPVDEETEFEYARHDGKSAHVVRLEGPTEGTFLDPIGSAPGSTATKSSVAQSATDVLLLAANTNRTALTVYNDSGADLYLSYGTVAASTTSFTTKLEAAQTWSELTSFQGEVRAIWASAGAGAARVTEETL